MRAVVADRWPVLREGVAEVLAQCGVSTVQHATTATEALSSLDHDGAAVVILGAVADMDLAVAVDRLLGARADARVVALVESSARASVIAVLDAGAAAVLARDGTPVDLREAVMRVAAGQRYVAPKVLAEAFGAGSAARAASPFTARELEVLALLAEGRSNAEIAAALFLGEATVKTHLRNAYAKLGVSNRVEAVQAVLARGLLDR